jgi:hypothetical protein
LRKKVKEKKQARTCKHAEGEGQTKEEKKQEKEQKSGKG